MVVDRARAPEQLRGDLGLVGPSRSAVTIRASCAASVPCARAPAPPRIAGFLLSQDWIDRRLNGLRHTAFAVEDLLVRTNGDDTAVVIGTQVVEDSHRGNSIPAQTRATRLASVQMAFVAGTPGAPPIPGPRR